MSSARVYHPIIDCSEVNERPTGKKILSPVPSFAKSINQTSPHHINSTTIQLEGVRHRRRNKIDTIRPLYDIAASDHLNLNLNLTPAHTKELERDLLTTEYDARDTVWRL